MKKILYINCAVNRLSTGRIVEQTGILAQSSGWTCYVACSPRYRGNSQLATKVVCSLNEVRCAVLQSRLFDNHGLTNKKATERLIRYVELIKPDIIHLHNIHGYYINYKILFNYLNNTNIKVIWTLHDCWSFTGHCAYFDRVNCHKWQTGCFNCPQIKEFPKCVLFDRSKRNWNLKRKLFVSNSNVVLVPVSNWLKNLCELSFWRENTNIKICTIHNGIDLSVFKPMEFNASLLKNKYNIGGDKMVLAVANGFGKRKGLADIIKLKDLLPQNITIVMVGVSEANKKIIPKGIVAVNRTENLREMAEFYSLADVFINPTYEDNFPTTNLEALACGTPVITYDTGGSPEAIDDKTGIVVPKGHVQTLAFAIEKVLSSSCFDSSNCRNRAVKFFDQRTCFQKYLYLYDSLINNK